MNEAINEILKAKDCRARARGKLALEDKVSLSLTLNIPGLPKSNELIHAFFMESLSDLKRFLLSHRLVIERQKEWLTIDSAGDFYLVPILESIFSTAEVKQLAEQFETDHPLGRLLDVDVTDKDGNLVSSGKAKSCYFCNEHPAVYCMRVQSHTYSEMRSVIEKDMANFLNEREQVRATKDLARTALKALLHEVSLSPKPGLVDRFSNGSHADMDFSTFLNSSAAISVYFKDIAELGFLHTSENAKNALPRLREIGLLMEEDMYRETGGVNTHKGAVFLLGFSLFASAILIKEKNLSYSSFVHLIKGLNGNLVERELGRNLYSEEKTHGEVCFEKYGIKGQGIRGEIQAGLPCVFNHAIPILHLHLDDSDFETDRQLQNSLLHTLLVLIANNEDSNILYRKGEKVLEELKSIAQNAFQSFGTLEFQSQYNKLLEYCKNNYISPGGSADLLAVSYFIYMIHRKYNHLNTNCI